MINNFKFVCPQTWWIVDVGFSHALEKKNATQAQKKCLHLDCQATNIFYQYREDNIFGKIMDMESAHKIWIYLNGKYGMVSDDDDEEPKEKGHKDVEHSHNSVIVEDCSTSWSSDDDDSSTRSMMMQQVMQMMMLLHAHLLLMKMMDMRVMSLQAHQHHHIALCHKVTQRYKMLMWLIILIQMMSLLVDLLA